MRRLLLFALFLCCISPAYALDWHLAMEAGVNEDTNLESRVNFRVARWYAGLEARQSDYADAHLAGGRWLKWIGAPARLEYEPGLQWRASLHYRAFNNNGPTINYTRLSDRDETYFVGWRAVIGNDR